MGEITVLTPAAKGKASLRTTLPMSIVKQFNLGSGDMLNWAFEVRDGEVAIFVKPVQKQAKDL
jgi:hypothetical protein